MPGVPWDDRRKFIAETVRTIVLAGAGTIAVALIVKPWESMAARQDDIAKTRLSISAKVVDDYLNAAHLFLKSSAAVCVGAPSPYGKGPIDVKDDFFFASRRLATHLPEFNAIHGRLEDARKLAEAVMATCTRPVPDEQWRPRHAAFADATFVVARQALQSLGFAPNSTQRSKS